jgi:antitoxin HigA-1
MPAEIQSVVMVKNSEPLHPGRILLERAMEPLGISRNQLARDIDVPVGRISDITNGKRGITADTALRFGRYFDTGPELWLRLQAEYDLHVARNTTWPEIEKRVRVLNDQAAHSNPLSGAAATKSPEIADEVDSQAVGKTTMTSDVESDSANNMGIPPAPEG